jgi:bifunctional UDP-N-acetylglucosamine pyrophosphorylase/glucosamine-1-phosphate N-acetyltransferase
LRLTPVPEYKEGALDRPSTDRNREVPKTKPRPLAAVVLAAGQGKRLKSDLPKVLHPVCGRAALWHVLELVRLARPASIIVIVGVGAEEVRAAVRSWGMKPEPVFVEQRERLGTGHAVMVAEKAVGRSSDVLVANGDLDPVRAQDIVALLRVHRRKGNAATVLTTILEDPGGYGRVVRDGEHLARIAEHADATAAERRIHEIATNWVAFRREDLYKALPLVGRDNRQHEYYLNDVYPILIDKGEKVVALQADTGGVMGFNSRPGLAKVERVLRDRINEEHMARGVTIVDPSQTYIDPGVRIARDAVIRPQTYLEGDTSVGAGCSIGPSSRLVDTVVGDGSDVSFSVVKGARIGRGVVVGPFAHVRPGTVLDDGSKVGSFVEMKASRIGEGSKVPHLSYVGDATVGRGANLGAGTVTVNYDGYVKHRTRIGDGARVGSDSMLVAPVTIGRGAVTGAGSTITRDVPAGALAVERSEQKIVKGYRERKDAQATASKPKSKSKPKPASRSKPVSKAGRTEKG